MKIYTKTGDAGQTGLFGGMRVDKDDGRVEAYGTVDETNAALGQGRAQCTTPEIERWLGDIQADLFALGAELACPDDRIDKLGMPRIGAEHIARLEAVIDQVEAELPPLKNFILPGGGAGAATLHHARTVARRAERRVISLSKTASVRGELLVYLNRLSDLLFVLARYENTRSGSAEVPWQPRGR